MRIVLPWWVARVDILSHVEPDIDLINVAGVDGIVETAGHLDDGDGKCQSLILPT